MFTVESARVWEQITLNTLTVRFAEKGLPAECNLFSLPCLEQVRRCKKDCQSVTSDILILQVSML